MSAYLADQRVLASLPVATWSPSPARVAVTEDGEFLVAVEFTPGRSCHRRFPVTALRAAEALDPPGSLVLVENRERLVLPILEENPRELVRFANALAVARLAEPWR